MNHSISCLALLLALAWTPAMAQTDQSGIAVPLSPSIPQQIEIELNKLEPVNGDCRAYFVVKNLQKHLLRELQIDTFLFDDDGLILRRVGLSFEEIPPNRMKVVLFDLGVPCDSLSKVLVNEVISLHVYGRFCRKLQSFSRISK